MPKITTYNIYIPCKKCDKQFFKKKGDGLRCHECRASSKDSCRKMHVSCRNCGRVKPESQSALCGSCQHKRYHRYVNRSAKVKVDASELSDLVYRIKLKQSGYIFSLFDVNDIIDVWYRHTIKRHDIYDHESSGHQIKYMWQDLLEMEKQRFKYEEMS